jgi:DNA-binding Xre family transcriptional regulator
MTMKWNLRMAAAQRDVWKASQLHSMLADAGLVISAGKMSHLWSGRPVTIRLEDLQVICSTLGCTPNDLLVLEQDSTRGRPAGTQQPELRAAAGEGPIRRRHAGRVKPPV